MSARRAGASDRTLAWLLLVFTAVGFGLRVWSLGVAGLWHDEASSWDIARRPLGDLVQAAGRVEHPPISFVLLKGWMGLAGDDELALRLPAAFAGTLTLPVMAALARSLVGRTGRWYPALVALLTAASPWLVWHSRQGRMYALTLLLVALAAWCGMLAVQHGGARRWAMLGLCSAAATGTHVLATLPLAGIAVGLVALAGRHIVRAGAVLFTVGVAGLVVAPWLVTARGLSAENASYFRGPLDRPTVLFESLLAIGAGIGASTPVAPLAGAVAGLLMLGGLGWLLARRRAAGVFVLSLVAVPVIGLLALLGAAPKFAPRYLLPAAVGPLLALGGGLAALLAVPRAGPALAGAAFVAMLLLGGGSRIADADLAGQSFREAVATLEAEAGPSDAVIVVGGHAEADYRYYARTSRELYPLPAGPLVDLDRPLGDVAAVLNGIAGRHPRVWLLRWQDDLADPARNVVRLLEEYAEPVDFGREWSGVRLHGYALPPDVRFENRPEIMFVRRVPFERGIVFEGFSVDKLAARPGETVGITLHWQIAERQREDLWAFIHFLNAGNQVYGQLDKRPVSDLFPMTKWQVDAAIVDPYWVQVPPGTPPGRYQIEVGLYRANGARIGTLAGGDHIIVGRLEVVPGEVAESGFRMNRQRATFGPIELVGFELERTTARPGERLPVRLFWRPNAQVDRALNVALRLVDSAGATVSMVESPPAAGTYPTDRWPPGVIVRDTHALVVPPTARGDLRIEIGLRDGGTPVGTTWQRLEEAIRIAG